MQDVMWQVLSAVFLLVTCTVYIEAQDLFAVFQLDHSNVSVS